MEVKSEKVPQVDRKPRAIKNDCTKENSSRITGKECKEITDFIPAICNALGVASIDLISDSKCQYRIEGMPEYRIIRTGNRWQLRKMYNAESIPVQAKSKQVETIQEVKKVEKTIKPKRVKADSKLIGSAPNIDMLLQEVRKHFFNNDITFVKVTDFIYMVDNGKELLDGLQVICKGKRWRLEQVYNWKDIKPYYDYLKSFVAGKLAQVETKKDLKPYLAMPKYQFLSEYMELPVITIEPELNDYEQKIEQEQPKKNMAQFLAYDYVNLTEYLPLETCANETPQENIVASYKDVKETFNRIKPEDAKGVIIAEYRINENDSISDYHGYSRDKTVILGFSKTSRNSFKEMRKHAAMYAPTKDLAENGIEYRQNYSMGGGLFIAGEDYYRGWVIRKIPANEYYMNDKTDFSFIMTGQNSPKIEPVKEDITPLPEPEDNKQEDNKPRAKIINFTDKVATLKHDSPQGRCPKIDNEGNISKINIVGCSLAQRKNIMKKYKHWCHIPDFIITIKDLSAMDKAIIKEILERISYYPGYCYSKEKRNYPFASATIIEYLISEGYIRTEKIKYYNDSYEIKFTDKGYDAMADPRPQGHIRAMP